MWLNLVLISLFYNVVQNRSRSISCISMIKTTDMNEPTNMDWSTLVRKLYMYMMYTGVTSSIDNTCRGGCRIFLFLLLGLGGWSGVARRVRVPVSRRGSVQERGCVPPARSAKLSINLGASFSCVM